MVHRFFASLAVARPAFANQPGDAQPHYGQNLKIRGFKASRLLMIILGQKEVLLCLAVPLKALLHHQWAASKIPSGAPNRVKKTKAGPQPGSRIMVSGARKHGAALELLSRCSRGGHAPGLGGGSDLPARGTSDAAPNRMPTGMDGTEYLHLRLARPVPQFRLFGRINTDIPCMREGPMSHH